MEDTTKKIVIVGHVDHGKSTLLGRILMDCGQLPEDRIAHVEKICADKGIALEPAFFLDALQEEQEQGISIDTTRVRFEFEGSKFVLIDAPGHVEFLKNMATGASEAELGILVVDCQEGVRAQTKRHLKILGVLGVRDVVVVVNKLDKTGYSQSVFAGLSETIKAEVEQEGLKLAAIVPISALNGENITKASDNFPWYFGQALLPLVCECAKAKARVQRAEEPFRMLLQDVYRFDDVRYFAGRVVSGKITPGSEVFFSPSGKMAKVASIENFPHKMEVALPGDSIALCLSEQIFVERGEIVSFPNQIPEVDNEIRAKIVWVSAHNFDPSMQYRLKIGTGEVACTIFPVASSQITDAENLANGTFADVVIKASKPLAFDRSDAANAVNKLVICSDYETVAFGAVDTQVSSTISEVKVDPNVKAESGYIERVAYERANGHKGSVIWLTGLSGAGKSTLAKALEQRLFESNYKVVVLDGDNLRRGLCAGLGFSPQERAENIRRVAQAARLFLDTGFIVIVAVISPYSRDREMARQIIGAGDFNEVFVFCPFEVCQKRDPKGLYSKVKEGQIRSFTGHDNPYQPPQNPALRLDSSTMSLDEETASILALLKDKGLLSGTSENAVPRAQALLLKD